MGTMLMYHRRRGMREQRKFNFMLMASALLCILVVLTHVSVSPYIRLPNRRLPNRSEITLIDNVLRMSGDITRPPLEEYLRKRNLTARNSGNYPRLCQLGWTAVGNDVPIPVLKYYKNGDGRDQFKGSIDLRDAKITKKRDEGTKIHGFNLEASQYLSPNQKAQTKTWSFEPCLGFIWAHETTRDKWFEEIKAMKEKYAQWDKPDMREKYAYHIGDALYEENKRNCPTY